METPVYAPEMNSSEVAHNGSASSLSPLASDAISGVQLPSGVSPLSAPGQAFSGTQGTTSFESASPLSQLKTVWNRPILGPVFLASLAFLLIGVLASAASPRYDWLSALGQGQAAFLGAYCCFAAFRLAGNRWIGRVKFAWSCLGIAAVLFGLGALAYAPVLAKSALALHEGKFRPLVADYFWVAQQPFLWLGLFLLAWRGRSLGLMRLLTDTLIVVLSAVVLLWSVFLRTVFVAQTDPATQALALYHPIFDAAHLFCVLMLIANVRERPGLARAAVWIFGGVATLILADSFHAYHSASRDMGAFIWSDFAQGITWSFLGIAALVHAHYAAAYAGDHPILKTGADDAVEAAPPSQAASGTPWETKLTAWHRSAILWLPYIASLSVSGVLVAQELKKSGSDTLERLLPVLSLLLAIVARQMITLWDNQQLAERLRSSNEALERNVSERTRHLSTLHDIATNLNTTLDKPTVLHIALDQTVRAVGASGGGIWLCESRRDAFAEIDGPEWRQVGWRGPDDPGLASLLRDLAIKEVESPDTHANDFHLPPGLRDAIATGNHLPRERTLIVPVRSQGHLLGVMALLKNSGRFSDDDRALVESVALEAGTALQNAQLYFDAERRADRDSVTELLNHRAVQEQLGKMLAGAKRSKGTFSLLMMDLNNFKFFNDTYGHPAGDQVLRTVARALNESCRQSDLLGRYGGDEFIILLPDTDQVGTIDVCHRIKATLDERPHEPVPGTKLPIVASFGWATFPHDGDNILELLTAADQNLYKHKRGGAQFLSQSARALRESGDELKKLKNRSIGGSFGVLDALVTAIDNKDHYTRHHSEEVTFLSLLVAKELGYDAAGLQAVRISGLLHDVGKIAVPDEVLRHPGKLGPGQWEIMQQHPVFGALIVKDVPQLDRVLEGIRFHHEKFDGSGYPEKLRGEEIPEMGRLLALADCYSALTTDRPYRKGWKPQAALEEIARCSGTHFDPRLCDVFLRVMERELASQEEDNGDYSARIHDDFSDEALNKSASTTA